MKEATLPGDPVLWEPPCMAINCPVHPKQPASPGRRRSPTSGAGPPAERRLPVPRRSKLEVSNERNRKLLLLHLEK